MNPFRLDYVPSFLEKIGNLRRAKPSPACLLFLIWYVCQLKTVHINIVSSYLAVHVFIRSVGCRDPGVTKCIPTNSGIKVNDRLIAVQYQGATVVILDGKTGKNNVIQHYGMKIFNEVKLDPASL
jgi:hypothetical protein